MPTILLSEAIAARDGDRITARPWFGPGWRIAAFRPGAGLAPEVVNDIQAAYLSSDILGGSTADMHEPAMEGFCTVLRQAANLAWLPVPSSDVARPVYQALGQRGVVLTTAAGAAAETVALTALTGLLALSRLR